MTELRDCLAPAKLNLFLHVIGRRDDGYHLLQSVFQLIDFGDVLHFSARGDGRVARHGPNVGLAEDDLSVRAARLLQRRTDSALGVDIYLEKRIPIGGGLGGGSSDAATTLLALNRLWQLGLTRRELMAIGLSLGADVPFFLFGRNAFVEGVGEQLTAVVTPERHFALIYPGRALSTALVFGAPELTRNTDPIKMSDFCADAGSGGIPTLANDFGRNDLEPVAAARLPEVAAALEWLGRRGNARMSGSGACVFCAFASQQAALESLLGLPSQWTGWTCSSLPRHPLADWANE